MNMPYANKREALAAYAARTALAPIDWVMEAMVDTHFSPDAWRLSMYQYQLMFVCDETSRGMPHKELLADESIYCGMAFTDNDFVMWKKKLGKESFPIPFRADDKSPRCPPWAEPNRLIPSAAPIKGELFAVRSNRIVNVLDKYKLNNVQFRRERVVIVRPLRERQWIHRGPGDYVDVYVTVHHRVAAWMYVGRHEFWDDQLDAGNLFCPVTTYPAENLVVKRYYKFRAEECY